MNTLDLLVAAAVLAAAAGGWRLGVAHRLASWAGMTAGLAVAVLALPGLAQALAPAAPRARLLAVLAFLAGMGLCGQAAGLGLGLLVARRRGRPSGPHGTVDRAGGALVGALGALVLAWLALPALANAPGWPARMARHSTVAAALGRFAPPPPAASRAVARIVAAAPYPEVFTRVADARATGPPPRVRLGERVLAQVAHRVVRVTGRACEVIQEGTGFAVADELVLTNAHVVAGERRTTVHVPGSPPVSGTVVAFDPVRDLALLRVDGLRRPPLPLGDTPTGAVVAVLGHPAGGPLRAAPARVTERLVATGTDITRRSTSEREVLVLAARLAPGDSGAPVVSRAGVAVGIAFAVDPASPDTAYALTVSEIRAFLADLPLPAAGTGPCLVGG